LPQAPPAAPTADAPEEPEPDLKALVSDLSDLLAALETALDNGETPDPSLIDKLNDTLDKVATALGLPVSPPASTSDAGAPAGTEPAAAIAPVPGAPQKPGDATAPNPLQQVADVARRVVERLATENGGLAAKVAEIGTALTNPSLAPAILAKLGIEAGSAVAAEVFNLPADAARAESKPAASPQPFTPPALKAPALTDSTDRVADRPASRADADSTGEDPGTLAIKVKPVTQADQQKPADGPKPQGQQAVAEPAPDKPQSQSPSPQQAATATVHSPAAIRAVHAAYQAPAQQSAQINIPQLAVDIVRHIQQGQSRFEIRLDPPELGRIDVKMDIDKAGGMTARLTVERAETLDLLQRDQRTLERALHQAGLDAGKTNLEFSLRQGPFERPQGGPQQSWHASGSDSSPRQEADPLPLPIQFYRATAPAGGLNIFV
jgi:hypothetical protein